MRKKTNAYCTQFTILLKMRRSRRIKIAILRGIAPFPEYGNFNNYRCENLKSYKSQNVS
jgi:hypothetical protein